MRLQHALVTAFALVAVASASAAVTPIGEFTGEKFEGFENIYPPGGYPGPIPIFNGFATMDDTLAHFCVIAYIWSGQGGEVYPYDGNLFGGTVAGSTLFQFSEPVKQFGGFFTTVGPLPGGEVKFRDAGGNLLADLAIDVTPTVWGWQGWLSDTPIASIEVIGANVPSASMQYDDLQVSVVPEPAALGLLALGAAFVMRRR